MSRLGLWEACLVAVSIDSSDPRFTTSTALPRGDDGVSHATIGEPPGAAVVQSIVPGCVKLSGGGHLRTMTQTVGLGIPEGETLGGGAMEHLTF